MTALLLDGAAVVVTGAGSGIGAALARRLTAAGARVVVNDRDPVAAQRVAAEVGGPAFPADVTDPAQVAALVDFAWESFGALDLFCANAGVAPPAEAANAWELAWRVNVLAHVHAAEALLPRWLAAGRGRLLVTASAAGLLTMLGNAPYAVTKHAAVSYAEWLRASYAHRGITVQALCPQGVRTPMLEASGPGGGVLLDPGAISAEEVAEAVVEALGGDSFLVLPHGEVADFYQRRATDPDRWLRGMNRLQQDLEKRLGTG
ncbi:SDR family oxidoreductase [Catellatospora bangladeshensis]|uniref:Dehydrogenase n=1 Tax=Catellatospora bangladeshensis TaxID=310355 RepID=A0A8J3J7P5_9ACTN|nr:SDR family oxidoreductase [Catellatospora bangladeshensis]GIF78801.1 dehydrogenase [Catellatospora bangladeshensis]